MKTIKKILGLALIVVLIAGCSDPKIDASSDESMKASVQKVRESLPESKRGDFDEAMKVLAFSKIDMKDLFTQVATGVGNLEGKVKESLSGKTGEQVIAEAARIQAERKERERQQALEEIRIQAEIKELERQQALEEIRIQAEIKELERQQALEEIRELETKRAKSESARDELKKFQVIRSRFYLQKQEFMGEQPIIELTVKNGTEQAVSWAYFEGTIASPDRSVPWHKDTFNYSISGGLEPGEEATWNLEPNMFSDWGKVDAPAEAIFTVTVEQLDGADGEPIYSTQELSERDLERLNELKKKYGVE